MTISYFCHDAKREGGGGVGGPRLNFIMTLIFLEIVWKCPLSLLRDLASYLGLETRLALTADLDLIFTLATMKWQSSDNWQP